MYIYQVIKDFAGPVATIIASIVAAVVIIKFNRQQLRISQTQSETAIDQLRYNLFEKRYAIYLKTKELIQLVLDQPRDKDVSFFEYTPYYISLREARFFFSKQTCEWLKELMDGDIGGFIIARYEHSSRLTKETGEQLIATSEKLIQRLENLPDVFASELEFSQLTRPSRTD